MRWAVPLAFVTLAAAAVLFLGLFDDGASTDTGSDPATTRGVAVATEPVLVGQGEVAAAEPEVDPFADETDVKSLLQRSWVGNGAQARLLELARTRAGLVAELVDWLRPDHDGERAPPQAAGQMFSGPAATPGLYVLGDTLLKLAPDTVVALAAVLDDEDPVFRERVAEVLGRMEATAAAATAALVARLEPGVEDVYGQCLMLRTLGAIGSAATEAVPVFLAYLRDDELADDARAAAAEGFFAVVGSTPEAFEAARMALRDQSFEVCTRLIPVLGGMGEEAAQVVPELLDIVLDPTANHGVESLAIECLGRVSGERPLVRSVLLDVAFDDTREAWRRGTAMQALARLGDEAFEPLMRRLGTADATARLLAATYLRDVDSVEPGRVLGILEPLRHAHDPEERRGALYVGIRVECRSEEMVDWLARWMEDDAPGLRRDALAAVARCRDESGRVIDLLVSALGDEDPEIRDAALDGLLHRTYTDHGVEAAQRRSVVVDAVRERLTDELPMLGGKAALWISRVAPTYDEEALPVWIAQLESGEWAIEMTGILRRLGPKARPALPALEAALAGTTWPSIQKELQRTIDAIRGR